MNIFDIVKGVLKTAARVAGLDLGNPGKGSVLENAVEVLERMKDTPEMRDAIREHEREMKALSIEELKVVLSENLAMLQSEDKFVARARPTGLYFFYFLSGLLIIAHILGKTLDPTFVWSVLGPLGSVGGLYVWKRTQEKVV